MSGSCIEKRHGNLYESKMIIMNDENDDNDSNDNNINNNTNGCNTSRNSNGCQGAALIKGILI
jgi:hypothetical protein